MPEREPWVTPQVAAKHLGYEPGDGSSRNDRAMRAFFQLVRRQKLPFKKVGALVRFELSEIDAAIDRMNPPPADETSRDRVRRMALEFSAQVEAKATAERRASEAAAGAVRTERRPKP